MGRLLPLEKMTPTEIKRKSDEELIMEMLGYRLHLNITTQLLKYECLYLLHHYNCYLLTQCIQNVLTMQ